MSQLYTVTENDQISTIEQSSTHYLNKKDIRARYLTTPFYSTINPGTNIRNHPEYINMYSTYDLFSLRTKMVSYLREILNIKSIGVRFDMVRLKHRMNVILIPIQNGEDFDLKNISNDIIKKIQDQINIETSQRADYCLALQTDQIDLRYGSNIIPGSWILTMIPILEIPYEYYGSYEIEELTSTGYLYLNLRSEDIYDQIYYDLVKSINSQLIQMYQEGYILGADNISESWDLVRVDSTKIDRDLDIKLKLGIYKPLWKNNRITQKPVEFLEKLIQNPETLEFKVPNGCNQLIRYYIARQMSIKNKNIIFDNDTVFINPVSGIKEAQEIVCFVYNAIQQVGRVVFLRSTSKEIAGYYVITMQNYIPYHIEYPPLIYQDSDAEHPYVAIGLLANYQNPDYVRNQILNS